MVKLYYVRALDDAHNEKRESRSGRSRPLGCAIEDGAALLSTFDAKHRSILMLAALDQEALIYQSLHTS